MRWLAGRRTADSKDVGSMLGCDSRTSGERGGAGDIPESRSRRCRDADAADVSALARRRPQAFPPMRAGSDRVRYSARLHPDGRDQVHAGRASITRSALRHGAHPCVSAHEEPVRAPASDDGESDHPRHQCAYVLGIGLVHRPELFPHELILDDDPLQECDEYQCDGQNAPPLSDGESRSDEGQEQP